METIEKKPPPCEHHHRHEHYDCRDRKCRDDDDRKDCDDDDDRKDGDDHRKDCDDHRKDCRDRKKCCDRKKKCYDRKKYCDRKKYRDWCDYDDKHKDRRDYDDDKYKDRHLSHHIYELDAAIKAVADSLANLGRGTHLQELLRIIHCPGWTSAAELAFVNAILDHISVELRTLDRLQADLVEASRKVTNKYK